VKRLQDQLAQNLGVTLRDGARERTLFDVPAPAPTAAKRAYAHKPGANPCDGCPCASHVKVLPSVPSNPRAVVIGLAPGAQEETEGAPFVGPSGALLRTALEAGGLNQERDVAYLNLARCRPPNDDFDSKEWADAERRCSVYLAADLARLPLLPRLLLGARPVSRFLKKKKSIAISTYRGLFLQDKPFMVAAAKHPASVLRTQSVTERDKLRAQFDEDVARFTRRILGTEPPLPCRVSTYATLAEAKPFLAWLANRREPWAFDIESFDGAVSPSRDGVATDPCHQDFRLRGIAFAWSADDGAWVELKDSTPAEARPFLAPAFCSDAPKRTFNGSIDEEALIYPGWVPAVNNRAEDAMLGLVALSDGRRGRGDLRLERVLVDLIGWPQYWNLDKSLMGELPIDDVARGAVMDACGTFKLCDWVIERMERGEYLSL
jgi:uracil-DNA glycosylase family 4